MLAGTLGWMAYAAALMFDMLLTTAVLVGLAEAARSGRRRGHALFALGIGMGILAKGPAVMLHLLPWIPGGVLLGAAGLSRGARRAASAALLRTVARVPLAGAVLLAAGVAAFGASPLAARSDVSTPSAIVSRAVASGAMLATTSAYNGEFGFLARLDQNVVDVGADGAPAWCASHPEGLIIDRRPAAHPPYGNARPISDAPFGGKVLRLWSCHQPASGLAVHPPVQPATPPPVS